MNNNKMADTGEGPMAIELQKVDRQYGRLSILEGANLSLKRGEMVGLLGPSGAGKSSLLHVAGLLEKPSSGKVVIEGQVASDLDDRGRTRLRRNKIGFIYQFHHLLQEFTALRNVEVPMLIAGEKVPAAQKRATHLLQALGLGERLHHQPAQLSG
ncbi:MAG: ATP-binding cassette domain-containing protein, partial [Pseudomonadota bacterium]